MMKKIVDQLELHVQWLALALSLAFVLYCAWAYLINPPVKVTLGSEALSPGDVDGYIWEHGGSDLETREKTTAVPTIELPQLVKPFTDKIAYVDDKLEPTQLAIVLPPLPDKPLIPPIPGPGGGSAPKLPGGMQPQAPVAFLPKVDPPKIDTFRAGMSNVGPNLVGSSAPPPDNGVQPAASTDLTWVTVRFSIDIAAIQKQFAAANIPPKSSHTSFLQVVLEREELMPDGTWGNDTMIAPQKALNAQAYPPAGSLPAAQWGYKQWAENNTVTILQPPFYQVIKGEPWGVPGTTIAPLNGNAPVVAAFDPTQYISWTPAQIQAMNPPFTTEQKLAISKAKAKDKSKNKPAPRAPTRGPGPGGPGGAPEGEGMHPAPNDAGRPPVPPPMMGPGAPGGAGEGEGGEPGAGNGQAQQANNNFPIPVGQFDPKDWIAAHANDSSIVCWATDETAQPGHSYHYRVGYKILNPIFFGVNVAKDPKLTRIFSIDSDLTACRWTDQIDLLPTVNFWLARNPRAGTAVEMQVFRWQSGETKSKTFNLLPGDEIGQKEGDIDFATGWSLVDIMTDPHSQEQYVLVMDPAGNIHKRDAKVDAADPKLKLWKDQATVAAAPTAGAGGIAGAAPTR